MGFFSFIANDTERRILIGQKVLIYLIDNKKNIYTEEQYEGYGEFGGKDIFRGKAFGRVDIRTEEIHR